MIASKVLLINSIFGRLYIVVEFHQEESATNGATQFSFNETPGPTSSLAIKDTPRIINRGQFAVSSEQ